MKKYLVVYERAGKNYSAFCPDLPGCAATGSSKREVEKNIKESICLHLEGLKEDNLPVPEPRTSINYVQV